MKIRHELGKKCSLIGSGIGAVLYAIFGLMQGAMYGGTAGLLMVNWLFGPAAIEAMSGELVTRVMVGGSMVAGVVVALVMFLTISSTAGYACGYLIGMMVTEEAPTEAPTKA
jgi:hypothetical protein